MDKIDKGEIIEEVADVIEHAIDQAPRQDVGFFLKVIAIAILIVTIGYAISLVFEGERSLSYENGEGKSITITKE